MSWLKIRSNRRNARCSTGPKTVSGKQRSSQNALQHGLSLPAFLFPPTAPIFERLTAALKGELAGQTEDEWKGDGQGGEADADSSATRFGLARYTTMTECRSANDPRSDPVASFSNTMLDLRRLRAERRQIMSRLIANPHDAEAGKQLKNLLRYGIRLNAQLKHRKRR